MPAGTASGVAQWRRAGMCLCTSSRTIAPGLRVTYPANHQARDRDRSSAGPETWGNSVRSGQFCKCRIMGCGPDLDGPCASGLVDYEVSQPRVKMQSVAGVDTVRGINYQHGHAILYALQLLADPSLAAIRVEGVADILDIEIFGQAPPPQEVDGGSRAAPGRDVHGPNSLRLVGAVQVKSRLAPYTWARSELLEVFGRWADLDHGDGVPFEFVTDAELGRSGLNVQDALESARRGDLAPLTTLLDVGEADPRCVRMSGVHIRCEPGVGIEALLLEAEREVRSLLPGGYRPADLDGAAKDGVDRLFRTLALRAGKTDAKSRIVHAAEVADIVGGVIGVPVADRWDTVRGEYLAAVQALEEPASLEVTYDGYGTESSIEPLGVGDLLDLSASYIIFGRTGTGKSTGTQELRRLGAHRDKAVVVAHAEAYLDGRLASLVAEAIGAIVGRDLSWVVGRQALSDPTTRVVIDGVSEVPRTTQLALAEETRPHLAANLGATMTFVGRDAAACSTLLPGSAPDFRFSPAHLAHARREELARLVLFPDSGPALPAVDARYADVSGPVPPERDPVRERCRAAVAEAEAALGDAVGNPMLLDMALRAIAGGVSFRSRSSLYSATLAGMSERGRTADISTASAGLGVVFSDLLDDGRRYANPLEWERLIASAASRLVQAGVPAEVASLRDDLTRSGIVSAVVTTIGHTAVRGPIHDSFADYLAGYAIAEGLVPYPQRPEDEDEQRLLFAAEMAGLPAEVLAAVVDSTPFALVGLSRYDRSAFDEKAPGRVTAMLRRLLPDCEDFSVMAWRVDDNILLQVGGNSVGWVTPEGGSSLAPTGPRLVLRPDEGLALVVARLWNLLLRGRLSTRERWLRPPAPATLDEARAQVEAHARATSQAVVGLLDRTLPAAQVPRVAAMIGPTGISAVVYPARESVRFFSRWNVSYSASQSVTVTTAETDDELDAGAASRGGTSVDSLMMTSPTRSAAKKIVKAINELVHDSWLTDI